MVKSTDLRNLNDPVRLVRLNCSTFWRVLIQRQVRAGFVIIAEIVFEQPTQMVVIEDDHILANHRLIVHEQVSVPVDLKSGKAVLDLQP
jgi:hypothetical protein